MHGNTGAISSALRTQRSSPLQLSNHQTIKPSNLTIRDIAIACIIKSFPYQAKRLPATPRHALLQASQSPPIFQALGSAFRTNHATTYEPSHHSVPHINSVSKLCPKASQVSIHVLSYDVVRRRKKEKRKDMTGVLFVLLLRGSTVLYRACAAPHRTASHLNASDRIAPLSRR